MRCVGCSLDCPPHTVPLRSGRAIYDPDGPSTIWAGLCDRIARGQFRPGRPQGRRTLSESLQPLRVVAVGLPPAVRARFARGLDPRSIHFDPDGEPDVDSVLLARVDESAGTGSAPALARVAVLPPNRTDLMAAALAAGADAVVSDDFGPDELATRISLAVVAADQRLRDAAVGAALMDPGEPEDLLGESPSIRALRPLLDRVGRGDASIAILGEPGTGRRLIARRIHRRSRRAQGLLVDLNGETLRGVAACQRLFGDEHEPGLVACAHDGTLLVRHLRALDPEAGRLLRSVVKSGRLPAGRAVGRRVSVRWIVECTGVHDGDAATRDLCDELAHGRGIVTVKLPPLRSRPGDAVILARHALSRGVGRPTALDAAAEEVLARHSWPGNVRELLTICELLRLRHGAGPVGAAELAAALVPPAKGAADAGSLSLEDVRRRHILRVMQLCEGNRTRAAQLLGIAPRTLYNRLREYDASGEQGLPADLGRAP